jgi:hypothetical protein
VSAATKVDAKVAVRSEMKPMPTSMSSDPDDATRDSLRADVAVADGRHGDDRPPHSGADVWDIGGVDDRDRWLLRQRRGTPSAVRGIGSRFGCCFDADRLDLPRCGITVDESLLSAEAARRKLRDDNATPRTV